VATHVNVADATEAYKQKVVQMVNSMCSLLLLVFKVKKKSSFPS
jgi:hypothetical protein